MGRQNTQKNMAQYFVGTPQSQPIPSKKDRMARNNAGGYSFVIAPELRLRRWFLLGSEGGSYYQSEKELTLENITSLKQIPPSRILKIAQEHIEKQAYIRPYPLQVTLVWLTTQLDGAEKSEAWKALTRLVRSPFDIFRTLSYVKQIRGWGRSVRRWVAQFYTRPIEKVAYWTLKYPNRDGWSHKDAIHLAHVKPPTPQHEKLFDYLFKRTYGKARPTDVPPLTQFARGIKELYEATSNADFFEGEDLQRIKEIIAKYRLTWDVLPTRLLNDPEIWKVLIENSLVPATAMLRQLPRLTKLGLTDSHVDKIIERLERGRFMFWDILRAWAIYRSGESKQISFKPSQKIVRYLKKKLGEFFMKAEGDISIDGKVVVAIDVSGSMDDYASGLPIRAVQLARLFGGYLAHRLPSIYVEFARSIQKVNIPPKNIDEALQGYGSGGTDCALPFQFALEQFEKGEKIVGVVILTDSETWAGKIHADEVIQEIRRRYNPKFKAINIPFVANPSSVLDPNDPLSLEVRGVPAEL
ncbi:MAG: hypothetical protein DRQ10_08395, partial [Candidatus Hydrothermota bacterium]